MTRYDDVSERGDSLSQHSKQQKQPTDDVTDMEIEQSIIELVYNSSPMPDNPLYRIRFFAWSFGLPLDGDIDDIIKSVYE